MSKETGGPAFPVEKAIAADGSHYFPAEHTGMTLRDYFAAKVLQGLMADPSTTADLNKIVSVSWGIADKMIAERSK